MTFVKETMKLHLARGLRQAGFTMIELLVVIAVIGVLAVAVLSSINPIEQINKGRDTRLRSDGAQLISAADRFFAIQGYYPWNGASTEVINAYTLSRVVGAVTEVNTGSTGPVWPAWGNLLTTTSEVKAGFITRVSGENVLSVFKLAGANETIRVCYLPLSRQFKQQALTNCAAGTTPASLNTVTICASTTDINANNYICLP